MNGGTLMKRRKFISLLCVCLLLLLLVGCSNTQAKENVQERIDSAEAQLGKDLGTAYRALGLPGEPADAEQAHYLYAPDSIEILEKKFAVSIIYFGNRESYQDILTDMPTDCISYTADLGKDIDFALKLRDTLTELYGAPTAMDGFEDLTAADKKALSSMGEEDVFRCAWQDGQSEIILSAAGYGTVSLEIQPSAS